MAEIALKITHVATDTHVEIYDNAFALTEYSDNVSTKYNAGNGAQDKLRHQS